MKYTTYLIAALFLASNVVYAEQKSKKKPRENATVKSENQIATKRENAVVSGQVFIVTKGGANIKLALVEVSVISEKEIQEYIKAKHTVALEQQNILKPKVDLAKSELEQVERTQKDAEIRAHEANKSSYFIDWQHTGWKDPSKEAEFKQATEEKRLAKRDSEKKLMAYFSVLREYGAYSGYDYYFGSLPNEITKTKTDADGKFSLSLPAGKYALAARASREVFRDTENYYWLIWVDASSQNQTIMLSNDNLFETNCNECVVQAM